MTTSAHEIEGMRAVPNNGEPWQQRLKPPHPAQVARAAGALNTVTTNRAQAYRIAYTLLDAGLLAVDPDTAEDEQWCVFHGGPDPEHLATTLVEEWAADRFTQPTPPERDLALWIMERVNEDPELTVAKAALDSWKKRVDAIRAALASGER